MGASYLSFWCHMGEPEVSVRYHVELERFFVRQKMEKGVTSGSFILILNSMEGLELDRLLG